MAIVLSNDEINKLLSGEELLGEDDDYTTSSDESIQDGCVAKEADDIINASVKGDLKKVKQFLEMEVNIDMQNECGYTALMMASKYEHKDIVSLLLEAGADLEVQVDKEDWFSDKAINFVSYSAFDIKELFEMAQIQRSYLKLTKELSEFNNLSDAEKKLILEKNQSYETSTDTKTNNALYSYELESYDVLKVKLIDIAKNVPADGILSIETRISEEENPFINRLYTMAIDGMEPEYIQEFAILAQEWLNKVHQRSGKQTDYLSNLNRELNMIRVSVISTMHGEGSQLLSQKIDATTDIIETYYKHFKDKFSIASLPKKLLNTRGELLEEINNLMKL